MQGGQRDAPKGWAPLQEWIEYTMQMALETEGADVGNNRANGGASRQPALTRRQRRRLQRPTQQQSGAAKPSLTNQAAGVARGADARPRVRLDKQQSAAAAMAGPATSQPEGNGAETAPAAPVDITAPARKPPVRVRMPRAVRPAPEPAAVSEPAQDTDLTLRVLAPRGQRNLGAAPIAAEAPATAEPSEDEESPQQDDQPLAQESDEHRVIPLRVPRRTKTLADAVRALRPAAPYEDSASANDDTLPPAPRLESRPVVARSIDDGEAHDTANAAARDARPEDALDAADFETEPPAAPSDARQRLARATRPITMSAPITTPVGQHAPDHMRARRPLRPAMEEVAPAPAPRFLSAVRRGSARFAMEVAIWHAVAGLLTAVAGSAMLLGELPLAGWTLVLAGLMIAGGAGAYVLLHLWRSARRATLVLVVAQVGAMIWAYALIGPQLAVVLLLPAAIWVAFRAGGRMPAMLCGIGGLCVYAGFFFTDDLLGIQPAFVLGFHTQRALNAGAVVVGISLAIAAIVMTASTYERSDAAARARLYEVRLLRAEIARLRYQTEEDSQLLEESLARALRGRGIDPITSEGTLSPVAESVNTVAERLATLQKDREDRLRLEGALRSLIRAVERAWLGLPWGWPESSGTMLDDLVALLRVSRAQQRYAPFGRSDETPTLVPVPPTGAPRTHAPATDPSATRADGSLPGVGWGELLGR